MLLPPNNPNKKFKKNKKTSASTSPEKSIPPKLVSLAKKLQQTIDHLSSSDSLDESDNENVDDITSLNCERVLSPQKTSSQIPNNLQPQFLCEILFLNVLWRLFECLKIEQGHKSKIIRSSMFVKESMNTYRSD
jgi:hypothetical protein